MTGGGGGGGLEREIENPLRKSGWLGDVGGENKKNILLKPVKTVQLCFSFQ